jgi:hypothetical protein
MLQVEAGLSNARQRVVGFPDDWLKIGDLLLGSDGLPGDVPIVFRISTDKR